MDLLTDMKYCIIIPVLHKSYKFFFLYKSSIIILVQLPHMLLHRQARGDDF